METHRGSITQVFALDADNEITLPESSAPAALKALVAKLGRLGGSVLLTASRKGWGPFGGAERKFQSSAVLYRRSEFTLRVLLSVAGLVSGRREWQVGSLSNARQAFSEKNTDILLLLLLLHHA